MGISNFLSMNNHDSEKVKWAPYSAFGKKEEKSLVLEQIKMMLNKNLPVVFSYHTQDVDNSIVLYSNMNIY